MVQWLGLGAFTARARVQSLVRESHKLLGAAKEKLKGKQLLLQTFKTSPPPRNPHNSKLSRSVQFYWEFLK